MDSAIGGAENIRCWSRIRCRLGEPTRKRCWVVTGVSSDVTGLAKDVVGETGDLISGAGSGIKDLAEGQQQLEITRNATKQQGQQGQGQQGQGTTRTGTGQMVMYDATRIWVSSTRGFIWTTATV